MSLHDITLTAARTKAANHRQAFPNATRFLFMPAAEVQAVLNQSGCETICFHLGLDDQNSPNDRTIVISGNNAAGERLALLKDGAWACPPNCNVEGLGE